MPRRLACMCTEKGQTWHCLRVTCARGIAIYSTLQILHIGADGHRAAVRFGLTRYKINYQNARRVSRVRLVLR